PETGIGEYASLFRHIRKRSVAVISVELVVTARGLTANARRMRGDVATRKIRGRIIEQKKVQATVTVVIQESCVSRKAGVGDAVLRGSFCESSVTVVDEQQVCALLALRPFRT